MFAIDVADMRTDADKLGPGRSKPDIGATCPLSKRGDGYIRRLLVHGARTVLRWRRAKQGTRPGWSDRLLARRPTNVVLVAMANKTARVAWALLRHERIYQPMPA